MENETRDNLAVITERKTEVTLVDTNSLLQMNLLGKCHNENCLSHMDEGMIK